VDEPHGLGIQTDCIRGDTQFWQWGLYWEIKELKGKWTEWLPENN
jgi:hypothetical protein